MLYHVAEIVAAECVLSQNRKIVRKIEAVAASSPRRGSNDDLPPAETDEVVLAFFWLQLKTFFWRHPLMKQLGKTRIGNGTPWQVLVDETASGVTVRAEDRTVTIGGKTPPASLIFQLLDAGRMLMVEHLAETSPKTLDAVVAALDSEPPPPPKPSLN